MESIVLTLHYVVCFFLIVTILLQAGKGADIGAVFGGASQTVFGGRGPATFLNKLTTIVAVLFLCTSVWLSVIAKMQGSDSVIGKASVSTPSNAVEGSSAEEPNEPAKDAPKEKN